VNAHQSCPKKNGVWPQKCIERPLLRQDPPWYQEEPTKAICLMDFTCSDAVRAARRKPERVQRRTGAWTPQEGDGFTYPPPYSCPHRPTLHACQFRLREAQSGKHAAISQFQHRDRSSWHQGRTPTGPMVRKAAFDALRSIA
jgi:hypothetical protein